MRHAARTSHAAWQYLQELNPDLALLQEVNSFPESLQTEYQMLYRKVRGKSGRLQRFGTAIVVRGRVAEAIELSSEWDWVDKELARFEGSFVAATVDLSLGVQMRAISVHSPAWPVDNSRISGLDVTQVRLKENPDVWGTELVWAALRSQDLDRGQWVVGGDFNSSETFDYLWPGGPRGNREFLERMKDLGFVECLRQAQGRLVPTFKNPRDGRILHQLDHMFVNGDLICRLRSCRTGEREVFDGSLSDHLPVIAEFDD